MIAIGYAGIQVNEENALQKAQYLAALVAHIRKVRVARHRMTPGAKAAFSRMMLRDLQYARDIKEAIRIYADTVLAHNKRADAEARRIRLEYEATLRQKA